MGACLRYTTNRNRMMTRNRQMGGGCWRYMRNRNRQMRGRVCLCCIMNLESLNEGSAEDISILYSYTL